MYTAQVSEILISKDIAHAQFYKAEVFGGPSLHFHHRSLIASEDRNPVAFCEASYAMLAAWGMHRMGPRGAKMGEFEKYKNSIDLNWPRLMALRQKKYTSLTVTDWNNLKEVFLSINVMQSKSILVSHSKVLAHAIPNLIPPVDRHYTIKFLHGGRKFPNTGEGEWELLKKFLEGFYYPLLNNEALLESITKWSSQIDKHPWDTSPLKVLDNLLVGHAKREA